MCNSYSFFALFWGLSECMVSIGKSVEGVPLVMLFSLFVTQNFTSDLSNSSLIQYSNEAKWVSSYLFMPVGDGNFRQTREARG